MELLRGHPARRILLFFLSAIAAGTILLWLPVSATGPRHSFLDSLFTATSAVCVTGLTVLDTGREFSLFGQAVILILIQLGGLGIMTFATLLLLGTGGRLSLGDRLGLRETFAGEGRHATRSLLKAIAGITLAAELVGALLLFIRFTQLMPSGEAAWTALFHAVSAFCNAGFSTFGNSLQGFVADPYTLTVFMVLIVSGGLGFIVLAELSGLARGHGTRRRLSLHTRLCLAATALLLIFGAIAFLATEYGNSLRELAWMDRVTNALFQSVTARTAGFSTLSQTDLTEVSLLVTLMLMFIGACPGSTGGGIKTTTAAVVLLLMWHRFRGRSAVSAFRRTVSPDSVTRAVTVFLLAVLAVSGAFALLMFVEPHRLSHRVVHGWFAENLFETVSAFGTVGLSLGRTGQLSAAGKLVIIATMFAGRVGLLTLAYALARPVTRGEVVYSEESVMVG